MPLSSGFFTTDQILRVQGDVLLEDTKNNPNLPASAVPQLNKALTTTNKQVVRAINEVKAEVGLVKDQNTNVMNALSAALGDYTNGLGGMSVVDAINNLTTKVEDIIANGTGHTGGGSMAVKGYTIYNYDSRQMGVTIFETSEYTESDTLLVYVEGVKIAENNPEAPLTFTRVDSTHIEFNKVPGMQYTVEIYVI